MDAGGQQYVMHLQKQVHGHGVLVQLITKVSAYLKLKRVQLQILTLIPVYIDLTLVDKLWVIIQEGDTTV